MKAPGIRSEAGTRPGDLGGRGHGWEHRWRLWSREGVEVLFVDQARDHVRAMNEMGLRVTGPVRSSSVPVQATTPSDLRGRSPSIFLCVKSQHTREAWPSWSPIWLEDGAVVSIQNGLCELEIAEVLGPERTVGAFVNFGADYLEPGVIHRGNRGATVVGEMDGACHGSGPEVFTSSSGFSNPMRSSPRTSSAFSGGSWPTPPSSSPRP